jgi:hypothetical protein
MLGHLIHWKTRDYAKPDHSSLRLQVASMLSTFAAIRGWPVLLNNQTATVLRRQFDTFVTADLRGIERPETIIAVVYLKDTACYEGVKEIQSDKALRGDALNRLADQITEALLRQVAQGG